MTYADIVRPQSKANIIIYNISLVIGGSILMALLAQLTVRLPFSPVPITGQTFGVLLLGALFGSRRGSAAMLAYILEGVAGLPVFAGGLAGPAVLAGPTGGYILGFVFAAYGVGYLAEQGWDRRMISTVAMMVMGTGIIYLGGLFWLSQFVPGEQLLNVGLFPFLPGAVIKIALAAILLPGGWKLLGRRDPTRVE
ncbi:MAG TPA: biotin transporter BioY [bacterium]|nr:biotin transporter BioY [bacterium]